MASDYQFNYASFNDYLNTCEAHILKQRTDLNSNSAISRTIVNANMPFEYLPKTDTGIKKGVLMVHGLLDSPFSFREIAENLSEHNIHCRSILLPGHGTKASDSSDVSYEDWQKAVAYGVKSFAGVVDELYIMGYSTGAALAINHVVNDDNNIHGLILLSPCIKIKNIIELLTKWHGLCHGTAKDFISEYPEIDYAKYKSISLHAVNEVIKLTKKIAGKKINTPMLMVLSKDDETISSKAALDFFINQTNSRNQMILYTNEKPSSNHPNIEIRKSAYLEFNIKNISHISLPFSAQNIHYGQYGDYQNASSLKLKNYLFGAFNHIQIKISALLYKNHITSIKKRELTYNPDFTHMIDSMRGFITCNEKKN